MGIFKRQQALFLAALVARFLALGLDLVFGCVMDENLVWSLWSMELTPLAPIVATGVGKQISLGIEVRTRNWALDGIEALEPLLIVLIPKVYLRTTKLRQDQEEKAGEEETTYHAIGSNSGKGSKLVVKADCIDRVHLRLLSVTLEGEAILSCHLLQVMDAYPSLDAPHGKPSCIGEARNAARLVFQGRFLSRIFSWFCTDIVGNNLSIGRGDHQKISSDV